ncbi:MAG: CDP-alcohol phosphatidyltransferase family protein [Nitrososphaerales archaeon]
MLDSVGKALGEHRVSPDLLTALGFFFSICAGLLFAFRPSQPYFAALAIIASGIMDVLDGAVARATGKVSLSGSLADSTLDRVSEIVIFSGIIFAGYSVPSFIVLLTLSFSLMVSYVRSKGEALAITMSGVGLAERPERLLILIAFSLLGLVWIGVYLILALAIITFVQRYLYISRGISQKRSLQGP